MALSAEEKQWINELQTDGSTYMGAPNITAMLFDNGKVEVNFEGLDRFLYESLDDFIAGDINGKNVNHGHSVYIGNRPDDGEIEFNDKYDANTMTIDNDEDGSSVYSNFIPVTFKSEA
jgi:hypothetical protein